MVVDVLLILVYALCVKLILLDNKGVSNSFNICKNIKTCLSSHANVIFQTANVRQTQHVIIIFTFSVVKQKCLPLA